MHTITIPKIRPASWKVYIQGEEEARYTGRILAEAGLQVTEPICEPGLDTPPLYSIIVTPKAEVPFTGEELVAVLKQIGDLELAFASA